MVLQYEQVAMEQQIDTQQLIEEVERRPLLWDLSVPQYSNKTVKDGAWRAVGEACGCSGAAAQARFKNLRTAYQRRKQKLPSGSGAQQTPRRPHPYDLPFLDRVRRRAETSSNLELPDPSPRPVPPCERSQSAGDAGPSRQPGPSRPRQLVVAPDPLETDVLFLDDCSSVPSPAALVEVSYGYESETQYTPPSPHASHAPTSCDPRTAATPTTETPTTPSPTLTTATPTRTTAAPTLTTATRTTAAPTPTTATRTTAAPTPTTATRTTAAPTLTTATRTTAAPTLTTATRTTATPTTSQRAGGRRRRATDDVDAQLVTELDEMRRGRTQFDPECVHWGNIVMSEMQALERGGDARREFRGKLARLVAELYQ
ncbi:mucin-7-like [Amphibalanus amphitrite]|uniref:mucin-7-like n=1 Tax=Amphibalanus amphitrite TaxID=1232801 RepID=UPI001C8FEACF|nr:mucin-7-like [Amphibalanus amphitrite]